MSDRYLWDKSGPPDAEVERMETLLADFAHQGAPLELPAEPPRIPVRARPRWTWALATAAALVAVAGTAWWVSLSRRGWEVATLSGAPRVAERPLAGSGRVAAGEWLVTDASSSARVTIGTIGVVDVGPNSRVRVIGQRGVEHRLALERGALEALILAPPRRFLVDTPSATAVDLGCAYALEVDATGQGMLTVAVGWVSFEHHGRESFIPAGARCLTRPGLGPGTPYFTDATPDFKNALATVDLTGRSPDAPALEVVLAEARREDAFTLWHLLVRLEGAERARVYDRLAQLVTPPPGVTRAGTLAADRAMLDRWWDALGLGGAQDWRRWKGRYPGERESG